VYYSVFIRAVKALILRNDGILPGLSTGMGFPWETSHGMGQA